MKKKNITYSILLVLLILQGICFINIIPINSGNQQISNTQNEFSLRNEYTYNITQFDSHFTWVDLDWTAPTKGTAYTNSGGQIKISVSHLGDKDLNDYSIFSEPLPYIDISFLENQSNTLIQNLSLTDISNSEVAMNLALSYNSFLSGFLIPVDNLTQLKSQAVEQVSSLGYMPGTLDILESNCSIKFDFKANDLSQNSTMLYDKWLGLLLWAKIENNYGPDIEIYIVDTLFNYNLQSIYAVTQFDSHFTWVDLNWTAPTKGTAYTNSGGQIKVNVSYLGDKDLNDYSIFSEPLPYIDISFLENQSNTLIQNLSLTDISNSEVAMNLALSYNSFLSGFLIPVDNLTQLKSQAVEQVSSLGYMPGTLDILESNCSIKFDFKANDLSQNSTMLYDKWLGLLLWAKIENNYGPDIEINLLELLLIDIFEGDDSIPGYEIGILTAVILTSIIGVVYYQNKRRTIN